MIFNEDLAKMAEQYLKKGSKVYIEGQLQTRKWHGQGRRREVLDRSRAAGLQRGELTMLGGRGGTGEGFPAGGGDDIGQSGPMGRPRAAAPGRIQIPPRDLDDEVPF